MRPTCSASACRPCGSGRRVEGGGAVVRGVRCGTGQRTSTEWKEAQHEERREAVHPAWVGRADASRSEEHTSELQSRENLVCRLLLENKTQAILHSLPT